MPNTINSTEKTLSVSRGTKSFPQRFEPSSDPEVIGIRPVPCIQDKIRALKEKYLKDIEDIEDEDADFDEEALFSVTNSLSHE